MACALLFLLLGLLYSPRVSATTAIAKAFHKNHTSTQNQIKSSFASKRGYLRGNRNNVEVISIVTIICGQKHANYLDGFIYSLINSHNQSIHAVPQTPKIHLIIVSDQPAIDFITPCLGKLQNMLTIEFQDVYAHNTSLIDSYRGPMFSCGIYKINIPDMLPNTRKVILIDPDCLILNNLSPLWAHFAQRPEVLLWGTAESHKPNTGWYHEGHGKKHFYPPNGLNSGVLMLNLHKMRQQNVTGENIIRNNTEPTPLPDQDLYNSWAYFHQDLVGVFPCIWNVHMRDNCNVTCSSSNTVTTVSHENSSATITTTVTTTTTASMEVGLDLSKMGIMHGNGGLIINRDRHIFQPFKDSYHKFCKA